jgi:type IX secretion system PorP/SprF family membrane protein
MIGRSGSEYEKLDQPPHHLFRLLLMLGFLTTNCLMSAQDSHFSQFDMSPLSQDPAMTGALYDIQSTINYRTQWQSVTTPYRTMAASFDMRMKAKPNKGFWAVGLNMYSDKAGDLQITSNQINLNIAYHVRLNDYNTLGVGIQNGVAQKSMVPNSIHSGTQYNGINYDPTLSTGENFVSNSFNYFDVGSGLVWSYKNTIDEIKVTDNHQLKFNVGLSLSHVNQPSYSFYNDGERLAIRYTLHGNGLICLPETNLAFVPGFLYYQQGPAREIYIGSLLRYKLMQDSKYTGQRKGSAISMGAFYRKGDGISVNSLIEYSNYAIGLSYDINTSSLQSTSHYRGATEITLRYVSPNPFTN